MSVKENLVRLAWRLRIGGWPLALLATALACACSSKAGHAPDDLGAVKQRIDQLEAVLVDVREQSEWNAGHVAGAYWLPTKALAKAHGTNETARLAELLAGLPKDKPIYCHCAKGVRALAAAKILTAHGYQATALKPGYDDLVAAGFTPEPAGSKADSNPTPNN